MLGKNLLWISTTKKLSFSFTFCVCASSMPVASQDQVKAALICIFFIVNLNACDRGH